MACNYKSRGTGGFAVVARHPGALADEDVDTAGKAWQVWSKPQENGGVAVLLISRALDMGSKLPPIDLSLRLSS